MSPALARRSRSVPARRIGFLAAVAVLLGGGSVASAIPPGGVKTNPGGAVVTVAPNEIAVGGIVEFTGTGFTPGEVLSVKIDDEKIFKKGGTNEVLLEVTGKADGTVSGSIDLANINPATPVNPGAHWVRLLSGKPRSLIGEFTVVGGAPVATPAPGETPAPGSTPAPVNPGTATPAPVVIGGSGSTPQGAIEILEITKPTILVKNGKATVKVAAGASGSAGKMRIKTLEKFKIGKGASKVRDVFKREDYYVEKLGKASIRVSLTADGKAVLKRRKAFKAIAEITDATGEKVTQTITVQR